MEDGDVISVAGPAVRGAERVGQDLQPLPQQPVDAGWVWTVAQALQSGRVLTGGEPVVEGLEADTGLGRLAFGPLVAVEAQLGVVRKIGTELDEERSEVGVEGVNVEVVDHRRGLDDPRVGHTSDRVATLLGVEHAGLLLGSAHEQDPLGLVELGQEGEGQVVFALPLGEIDDRNVMISGEAIQTSDEVLADRFQQGRGRERVTPVVAQERHHSLHVLQTGLVDVQVHPVDTLHLQDHVVCEDVSGSSG